MPIDAIQLVSDAASLERSATLRGPMTLANLPRLIRAFLEAVAAQDRQALAALFADDARVGGVVDLAVEQALDSWMESPDRTSASLRPINLERRGDQFALVILLSSGREPRPTQVELAFRTESGKIAAVDVTLSPPIRVDPTVAEFIAAVNAWDLDAIVAAFSDDAMVNDQLEEHWGAGPIREWAETAIADQRFTMFVTDVVRHYECIIVRANVDGEFDKRVIPEPLPLTFYFDLTAGKITRLMILRNQSEQPA